MNRSLPFGEAQKDTVEETTHAEKQGMAPVLVGLAVTGGFAAGRGVWA